MTRLISEWISDMEKTAAEWDEKLHMQTGIDFVKIAAMISECSEAEVMLAAETNKVAVVPITSGLGTISSFAESVAAIVKVMGFDAFVTEATDVNGIYEAHVKDADYIYMADDDRYIVINLRDGKIGDNNIGTSSAYSAILEMMADGLNDKNVAVLGFGIIGQLMAMFLEDKGAEVSIYDKDTSKKGNVIDSGYGWIKDVSELKQYSYIADATSEGGWLTEEMLADDAVLAMPGVPLSLTEEAQQKYDGKYVHDLLEIGTAAMIGLVI